jgi:hypothetical protein
MSYTDDADQTRNDPKDRELLSDDDLETAAGGTSGTSEIKPPTLGGGDPELPGGW